MQSTERRRQFFKSFEAKSLRSRSLLTQISDNLTAICGSTSFLLLNFFCISFWLLVNFGLIPGIPIFDPFPFGFLTMILSIEAILLAIFILVSQNRSSYVNTIRDEVHMRVNLIAEEEITKILQLLAEIRKEMGITSKDPELAEMLKRINTNYIEKAVVEQMDRANISLGSRARELVKEFPDLLVAPVKAPIHLVEYINKLETEEEKKLMGNKK